MGVIAKDSNKITLFYTSQTQIGKQTLAYVKASRKKILSIDISKTKVTPTQWSELADNLGIEVADLINKKHPDFIQSYGDQNLNLEASDWFKVLSKSPELLINPILLNGDRVIQIANPSDVVKFL